MNEKHISSPLDQTILTGVNINWSSCSPDLFQF